MQHFPVVSPWRRRHWCTLWSLFLKQSDTPSIFQLHRNTETQVSKATPENREVRLVESDICAVVGEKQQGMFPSCSDCECGHVKSQEIASVHLLYTQALMIIKRWNFEYLQKLLLHAHDSAVLHLCAAGTVQKVFDRTHIWSFTVISHWH